MELIQDSTLKSLGSSHIILIEYTSLDGEILFFGRLFPGKASSSPFRFALVGGCNAFRKAGAVPLAFRRTIGEVCSIETIS